MILDKILSALLLLLAYFFYKKEFCYKVYEFTANLCVELLLNV